MLIANVSAAAQQVAALWNARAGLAVAWIRPGFHSNRRDSVHSHEPRVHAWPADALHPANARALAETARCGAARRDAANTAVRRECEARQESAAPVRAALRNREHSSVCPQHAGPERVASGSCLRQLSVRALTKL